MLHQAHGKPSRNATQQYGEQNPRHHDCMFSSVAGKADGVTGVVGRIVQPRILGEANTKHQK